MAQEGKITITNMVYGLGAAIVIVGALFKIQHWPFASLILILGMIVEALVFTWSAFEKQTDELDWTVAYPELAGGARGSPRRSSLTCPAAARSPAAAASPRRRRCR